MTKPFVPRPVARDVLAYRNLLSHRRAPVRFQWAGAEWQLKLAHGDGARPGRLAIVADWGGARVVVRAGRAWLEELAHGVIGAVAGGAIPDLLLQAVLEAVFDEASTQLEAATRKRVRIDAVSEGAVDLDGLECLGWEMDNGAAGHGGEIWVDALGLSFLAAAARPLALTSDGGLDLEALPIPVRLSVGWVDLPAGVLARTEPRDVLLLDECWLQASDRLMVNAGRGLAFEGMLKGQSLEVTQGWRRLMDENLDELDTDRNDEEAKLDELPVRLTFDLGERSVALGELRTLMPGYTFELGRDVRRAVIIRANGRAVGEGELVEVDGRIGVSILHLSTAAG